MKKTLITIGVLAVIGGVGYWYADYRGWLNNFGPDNLPTAEERQRMEEVERSSAQRAPNAKPGAGVFLKGTLPPKAEEQPASSTSASTTDSAPTTATTTF